MFAAKGSSRCVQRSLERSSATAIFASRTAFARSCSKRVRQQSIERSPNLEEPERGDAGTREPSLQFEPPSRFARSLTGTIRFRVSWRPTSCPTAARTWRELVPPTSRRDGRNAWRSPRERARSSSRLCRSLDHAISAARLRHRQRERAHLHTAPNQKSSSRALGHIGRTTKHASSKTMDRSSVGWLAIAGSKGLAPHPHSRVSTQPPRVRDLLPAILQACREGAGGSARQ